MAYIPKDYTFTTQSDLAGNFKIKSIEVTTKVTLDAVILATETRQEKKEIGKEYYKNLVTYPIPRPIRMEDFYPDEQIKFVPKENKRWGCYFCGKVFASKEAAAYSNCAWTVMPLK